LDQPQAQSFVGLSVAKADKGLGLGLQLAELNLLKITNNCRIATRLRSFAISWLLSGNGR